MRIALVGLGGMGTTHYLNYLHIPDAQVVAAVGKAGDRAQRPMGPPRADTAHGAVRRRAGGPGGHLRTHLSAKPLALEAIRHGLHVITEKPIALCLTDAQEM